MIEKSVKYDAIKYKIYLQIHKFYFKYAYLVYLYVVCFK